MPQVSIWDRLFGLKCPDCGGVISNQDIYCLHCGVKLDEPIAQATKTVESSEPNRNGEGQDRLDLSVNSGFRRKPAIAWLGYLLFLAGLLLFIMAFSHFPLEYWDTGIEVRWYKIDGLDVVNDEVKFTYGLIQPDKGDPTNEELTQIALARNPSFFNQIRLNEFTSLLNFPGGMNFQSDVFGKGYEKLASSLAGFEVIPGSRPRNGLIAASASVVIGLFLIILDRRKMK
jgi:hypothetical protein